MNVHPSAYPFTRVRSSAGTAPTHHGSARGSCSTSVPGTIRTPVSSSPASAPKASYDAADQAVTRSCGSARYGYQSAAATADVVSSGRSRATTSTRCPASSSRTAQDSPTTPAPTTITRCMPRA